jgi:hypothetical protein
MEDFLIEIIRNKEFIALNDSEKLSLKDWCENEDEFNQLKQVFSEVDAFKFENESLLNHNVKYNLDNLYHTQHKKHRGFFLNATALVFRKDVKWYSQPAAHIAALFVVFFSVYSLLKLNPDESQLVADNVVPEIKQSKKNSAEKQTKNDSKANAEKTRKPLDLSTVPEKNNSVIKEQSVVEVPDFVILEADNLLVTTQVEQDDEIIPVSSTMATSSVRTVNAKEEMFEAISSDDHLDIDKFQDVVYQVKPVSAKMLDVLYTMY